MGKYDTGSATKKQKSNETFHDRFLIIDDKELYLIGASLKDLGRKCFAFTKLDPGDISRIKKAAFASA